MLSLAPGTDVHRRPGNGVDALPQAPVCHASGLDSLTRWDDARTTTAGSHDGPHGLGLELSDAQVDTFYDRLGECMDVRGVVVDAMAQGAGFAPEQAACIEAKLTDDTMKEFLVMFTEGRDDIEDNPELVDAMTTLGPCLAPDTSGD